MIKLQNLKNIDIKNIIYLFITGFFMGSADLVPGVSGGTIAFISGIYENLLSSIKNGFEITLPLLFKAKFKEAISSINWTLFIPLGLGVATAFLLLSRLIESLLKNQPIGTNAFFFGLVVASIVSVFPLIKKHSISTFFALIFGVISMFFITGIIPSRTPDTWWAYILSSMIAICAMILPGISGSFILLLLGKYNQVLEALNTFDILTLTYVIIGCVIGIGLFSKILTFVFNHYHDVTVALLTGVMIGSLRKIWPWREGLTFETNYKGETITLTERATLPDSMNSFIIAVVLACIGFGIVIGFEYLQKSISKFTSSDKV